MKALGKTLQKITWFGTVSSLVLGFSLAQSPLWAADSIFSEEVSKGKFSIGGRAMYYDPIGGDDSWYGGAQARWYLNEVFALEGSMDYRKNGFGSTSARTFPLQLSGLAYLLPGKRVSPFLIGGGGWYYTDVDGPNNFNDAQQRFGLHAGGGLQVMLNSNWSVDGSYRWVWLERIHSRDSNGNSVSLHDEGHMVTVGLNYHF